MGKALYRKYRSKSLDEIVGQEHITTTLANALKAGNISHAYLFTGPRGVGKTSIARILAHEINQLAYEDETNHLDIIEIDAASNRRIDEIRELRERVHIAPTSAKYKVYIIDEVHMLTKEAFNALLKTLEEPPAHAVFILATTESHKLPDTIISRTQRFTFKPVDQDKVIDHLRTIAAQEGFTIDDEGLALLASHGGGSFRDSISMLDQARGHGKAVSRRDVESLLGIAPDELISQLLTAISSGTAADIVSQLTIVRDQGYQAAQIAKQLATSIRQGFISGNMVLDHERSLQLLDKLLAVPTAHDQMARLELTLIEAVMHNTPSASATVMPQPMAPPTPAPQAAAPPKPKHAPKPTEEQKAPKQEAVKSAEAKTKVAAEKPKETPTSTFAGKPFDKAAWDETLTSLRQTHNTLYSVARMAEPTISGDELTLTFGFAFHQKRINETKNRQVISDVIERVTGKPIQISCVVGTVSSQPKELSVEPKVAASTSSDSLSTISNIFGSAEVLES